MRNLKIYFRLIRDITHFKCFKINKWFYLNIMTDIFGFDVNNFSKTKPLGENQALTTGKNKVVVVDRIEVTNIAKSTLVDDVVSLDDTPSVARIRMSRNFAVTVSDKRDFAIPRENLAYPANELKLINSDHIFFNAMRAATIDNHRMFLRNKCLDENCCENSLLELISTPELT